MFIKSSQSTAISSHLSIKNKNLTFIRNFTYLIVALHGFFVDQFCDDLAFLTSFSRFDLMVCFKNYYFKESSAKFVPKWRRCKFNVILRKLRLVQI